MAKEKIINVPNFFTLLRLLCIPLFVFLTYYNYPNIIIGSVFLFGALTDVCDGQIARRFNQKTKFGAIFDQIADRTFVLAVIFSLLVFLNINIILLLLLLSREFIGFFGVIIRRLKRNKIADVRFIGKLTMVLQCITIFLLIINFNAAFYIVIITFIIGIFSGFDYLIRGLK